MDLQDIIDSVDILAYISQYCDMEERRGEYWGLSPLKEENTPSFSVNPEQQLFYDFSSGKGGSVLTFICLYHKCDLHEGIRILKEYAGIGEDVPVTEPLQCARFIKRYRHSERQPKESTAKKLPDSYMDIFDEAGGRLAVWKQEGMTDAVLRAHQVMYDNVDNRLVFPIKDIDGNIINVCGRTLYEDFKRRGLRKYTYYKSMGSLQTLYWYSDNLPFIRSQNEVILFEGAKSVMIAESWGIRNTCAVLTSHLSRFQVLTLVRLGVPVVLAFDKDAEVLSDENARLLSNYVDVSYIFDSNDLLQPKMAPVDAGKEIWDRLYAERVVFE